MPREAAEAVSTIGRKPCAVASVTASQRCSPLARSMSIWSIRIVVVIRVHGNSGNQYDFFGGIVYVTE
jgi:hypothetical protein